MTMARLTHEEKGPGFAWLIPPHSNQGKSSSCSSSSIGLGPTRIQSSHHAGPMLMALYEVGMGNVVLLMYLFPLARNVWVLQSVTMREQNLNGSLGHMHTKWDAFCVSHWQSANDVVLQECSKRKCFTETKPVVWRKHLFFTILNWGAWVSLELIFHLKTVQKGDRRGNLKAGLIKVVLQ